MSFCVVVVCCCVAVMWCVVVVCLVCVVVLLYVVVCHAEKTPVCAFKTPACVRSKRPRVYGTTRTCFSTCARGAGTHGDVLNVHTQAF